MTLKNIWTDIRVGFDICIAKLKFNNSTLADIAHRHNATGIAIYYSVDDRIVSYYFNDGYTTLYSINTSISNCDFDTDALFMNKNNEVGDIVVPFNTSLQNDIMHITI